MLDELVIALKLDRTQFDQDSKAAQDAVRRTGDETTRQAAAIETAGNRAVSFFTKLRNEAIALFGLFVGATGIKDFISQQTALGVSMGISAQQIGIQVEQLGAWSEAAKRFGIDSGTVVSSLGGFRQEIERMRAFGPNNSPLFPMLAQLGVQITDPATGQVRDLTGMMAEIRKRFDAQHYDDPQRLMFLNQMNLGGIAPMLSTTAAPVENQLADVAKRGLPNDQFVKVSNDLNTAWANLSQTATTLGRNVFVDLEPYLGDAATTMEAWIKSADEWIKKNLPDQVGRLGTQIKGVDWKAMQVPADDVAKSLGGWMKIMEAVALYAGGELFLGVMTRVFTTIGGLVGAVATRIGAINAALIAITAWEKAKDPETYDPKNWGTDSPLWRGMPDDEQKKYPNSPLNAPPQSLFQRGMNWLFGGGAGGGGNRAPLPLADTSLNPDISAFLSAMSIGESGGVYNGPNSSTGARGRYQFVPGTLSQVQRETGITDFEPTSQDRMGAYYARQMYQRNTGRNLDVDLRSGEHDADIATSLNRIWTSLPGGPESHMTMQQWMTRLRDARAATGPQQQQVAPHSAASPQPSPPLLTTSPSWYHPGSDDRTAPAPMPDMPTAPPPPAVLPPLMPIPEHFSALSGARLAVAGIGGSAAASAAGDTNINGPITVHTQATDANGIARDMAAALRRHVTAADTGLV